MKHCSVLRAACSILLCVLLINPPVIFASGEAESADIPLYCGNAILDFEVPADALLEINGEKIPSSASSDSFGTLTFTATGVEVKTSSVFLGETKICDIVEGENTAVIPLAIVAEGTNSLTVRLAAGEGKQFSEDEIYGSYNLDDMVLSNFSITRTGGAVTELNDVTAYLPIIGKAGVTEQKGSIGAGIKVGDGWSADTGLGGSTPGTPVMIGVLFENDSSAGKTTYVLDTKSFPDGTYPLRFYEEEADRYLDLTSRLRIDNTPPDVASSVATDAVLTAGTAVGLNYFDETTQVTSAVFTMDDEPVSASSDETYDAVIATNALTEGRHTLCARVTDEAGNVCIRYFFFTVVQPEPELSAERETQWAAVISDINLYVNHSGAFRQTDLRTGSEELVQLSQMLGVATEAADCCLPIQSFVADASSAEDKLYLTYRGTTADGGKIVLKAWSYAEKAWKILGYAASGVETTIVFDPADFRQDGLVRINAMPYIAGNGSDTILWHTDTQYYTRFDDLNVLYKAIVDYAVEQYQNGGIGYVANTGDIVDEADPPDVAQKQYAVGDAMQKILDDADVPNGIVSGNHDICHDEANYTYFKQYFPASRYTQTEWYGGSLDYNTSHYDLITVGGYDFVLVYLGCKREADDDTLAWATEVLQTYRDRNAIILTHEYLLPSGAWSSAADQVVWEKLVVPNPNVKIILCGHNEGVCDQLRTVEGTDRTVLEILADYQFAELGKGPEHVINGMTCDGEGFLRLLTFNAFGQLSVKTYSPYWEKENYFAPYSDSFVYDLDLMKTKRSVTTDVFMLGIPCPEDEANAEYETRGEQTTLTATRLEKYGTYEIGTQTPESAVSEKIGTPWYAGVAPSLTRGTTDQMPVCEAGMSLLPDDPAGLVRTSGNTTYTAERADEGGIRLSFDGKDGSWVTLAWQANGAEDLSEYNRLYFSVEADASVKWNLMIITSRGKELNFSQNQYAYFGYESYAIPSDISGSWYGWLPLTDMSEGETIRTVYLVGAVKNASVRFGYLFAGKQSVPEMTFTAGTAARLVPSADGYVQAPDIPYAAGMTFAGWVDGEGQSVTFPCAISEDLAVTARFAAGASGITCYEDERKLAPVVQKAVISDQYHAESGVSEPSPTGGLLPWLIGGGALILIAVVVVLVLHRKKSVEKK